MGDEIEINMAGLTLNNKNLIFSDNLTQQLVMILEILGTHAKSFDDINSKVQKHYEEFSQRFDESNAMVKSLESKVKKATDELKQAVLAIDDIDKNVKRMETRMSMQIQGIEVEITNLKKVDTELQERLDNHEPRILKCETELQSQAAKNEEAFREIHEKVDKAVEEQNEKVETLDKKHTVTRNRLEKLEKQFKDADIEGLTAKVVKITKDMDVMEKKSNEHDERLGSLETGQIHIRKEVSEIKPYCHETFSTIAEMEDVKKQLEEFLTRKEFLEVQDDFHAQMTNFLVNELDTQRNEIYSKMANVQERLSAEIEELTSGEEVAMCVEKLQAFTKDVEDIGMSVSQHNEAIEASAQQLEGMGSEFVTQIDVLKASFGDMNVRLEDMMRGMHDTVASVLDDMKTTSGFGGLFGPAPSSGPGDKSPARSSSRGGDSRPQSGTSSKNFDRMRSGTSGQLTRGASVRSAGDSLNMPAEDEVISAVPGGGSERGSAGGSRPGSRPPSALKKSPAGSRPASAYRGAGEVIEEMSGNMGSRAGSNAGSGGSVHSVSLGPNLSLAPVPSVSDSHAGGSAIPHQPSVRIVESRDSFGQPHGSPTHVHSLASQHLAPQSHDSNAEVPLPGQVEQHIMGALHSLQTALEHQMGSLRNKIFAEFVPRNNLDNTLRDFTKRFADMEWKMHRVKHEAGPNEYKHRMFNQRLFGMHAPFLKAQRHPAAPEPQLSTIKDVGKGLTSIDTSVPVAVHFFESTEMRKALHEGREPGLKGAAPAHRIFKKDTNNYEIDIPPSVAELMETADENNPPGLEKPRSNSPQRVTMLPRLQHVEEQENATHVRVSDATHPWQMKPPPAR